MKRLALSIVAIASIMSMPAGAQNPERLRITGTVEKIDGDRLAVSVAGGKRKP